MYVYVLFCSTGQNIHIKIHENIKDWMNELVWPSWPHLSKALLQNLSSRDIYNYRILFLEVYPSAFVEGVGYTSRCINHGILFLDTETFYWFKVLLWGKCHSVKTTVGVMWKVLIYFAFWETTLCCYDNCSWLFLLEYICAHTYTHVTFHMHFHIHATYSKSICITRHKLLTEITRQQENHGKTIVFLHTKYELNQ